MQSKIPAITDNHVLSSALKRRKNAKCFLSSIGVSDADQLEIANILFPKPVSTKVYDECPISKRECQIIQLICNGNSYFQISHILFISINTIKTHVSNIYIKTGCTNHADLYTYAFIYNII